MAAAQRGSARRAGEEADPVVRRDLEDDHLITALVLAGAERRRSALRLARRLVRGAAGIIRRVVRRPGVIVVPETAGRALRGEDLSEVRHRPRTSGIPPPAQTP